MTSNNSGPLAGVLVIELASERVAFAGKLLGDMGADVVVVEPPGGDPTRSNEPFLEDMPGPERSLYWWHYNTSKRSVVLDLDEPDDREIFRQLVAGTDILLEGEPPGRLAALELDDTQLRASHPGLITASVTPFGQSSARSDEPSVDLTILAGGGPVWSCGYDDHSLPPVRGGGNQGFQTGCHFAVMSVLVSLLAREETGRGQHIDVNLHAAANVTTEAGSYEWLVARTTVQRQTGRHAGPQLTMESQVQCADGRWVNTGVPPMKPVEFKSLLDWVDSLGLGDDFPERIFLEMGMKRERIDLSRILEDQELQAIFGAGREAVNLIASRVSAYDFFTGAQKRGLSVGIIYSPEEVMDDPHFVERGFRVPVVHDKGSDPYIYPGAPIIFHGTPWRIQRRAPRLGEHDDEILGPLRRG